MRKYLLEMYDYVIWADDEMLRSAETVPAGALQREMDISFGSIHKLIVHMMSAQYMWHERWIESPSPVPLDPKDFAKFDAIRERWESIRKTVKAFIEAETDDTLERRFKFVREGVEYSMVLRHSIWHMLDHATYHRGQINSMIKLAGGKPRQPALMVVSYLREKEQP